MNLENILPGTIGKLFQYMRREIMIRGVLFLLLGGLMMFRPASTMKILTVIIGIFIAIDGGSMLAASLSYHGKGKILSVIGAASFLLLGITTIVSPLLVNIFWIIMIGCWQLLNGIQCLIFAGNNRWTAIISGVLSLLTGFLLIASPMIGFLAISWLLGLMLFMTGLSAILLGIRINSVISE